MPLDTSEKKTRQSKTQRDLKRTQQKKRHLKRSKYFSLRVHLKMGVIDVASSALLVAVCLLSTAPPSLAVYSNGECTFNTKGSCEYQGQVFGIGDSWITNDCYHCVCMEPFGVGCCDHNPQPVDYPDWCDIIRKPDSCVSVVVMKANHKLPCLYGKLGKHPDTWKSVNDPIF